MDLIISGTSDVPIYQQIATQIAAQIIRGDLPPGAALPPIRTVARQLEVSVITVKKAWDDLEAEGFIYGVVGKGTFVAEHGPGGLDARRAELAAGRMARDLPYYRDLGLTADEVVALVRRLYE